MPQNTFSYTRIAQKSRSNKLFIEPWLNHQETCTELSLCIVQITAGTAKAPELAECSNTSVQLCLLVLTCLSAACVTMTKI